MLSETVVPAVHLLRMNSPEAIDPYCEKKSALFVGGVYGYDFGEQSHAKCSNQRVPYPLSVLAGYVPALNWH